MSQRPLEDRETAATRAARLAWTRASRSAEECSREVNRTRDALRAARRDGAGPVRIRLLEIEFSAARDHLNSALRRAALARRDRIETEAAERAGLEESA